ncbi:MAG: DHHA1 domain-containing protein [Candidatus Micrarchaeota archaeon]|nr:DHHA1 domain-containing protein [Candidatus Micrarchaeota archaeon]
MASSASSKKRPASPAAALFLKKLRGKRVVITFHVLGDLDAAGSAIALARFIGQKAVIAPPDAMSASARRLFAYTGTKTEPFSPDLLAKRGFLAVLDSSSPSLLPHLAGLSADLAIDHHIRSPDSVPAKLLINDPQACSTSEMLYFLLRPSDKISSIALLLGIISDSAGFQNATSRTFEAVSALLSASSISYSAIKQLAFAPQSLSERIEALRSCQSVRAERIGEHLIAAAMAKSHEGHFAEMLVRMGADIAFVGCEGSEGVICARMRQCMKGKVSLGRIMSEAGKVLGGSGGGHELAAAASGSPEAVREALAVCTKLAEQQILSAESGRVKKIEW